MGRYNFTEEDLEAQLSDGLHPAILQKCEARLNKKQDGDNIYWEWVVQANDDKPSNVGQYAFAHTPVVKGKGGFLMNYLRDLGVTWEEFDNAFADGDPVNHMLRGVEMNIETKVEISPDKNGVAQKQVRVLKIYPTE